MTDKTPKRSRPSITTKLTAEKINGTNVFTYKLGDGNKQMESLVSRRSATNRDKLKFGEGIRKEHLSFKPMGNDLKITITGAKPGLLFIRGFLSTEYNRSQTYSFKKIEVDGYTLPITSVRTKLLSGMQPEWQPVVSPESTTHLDQLTSAFSTLSDKHTVSSPKNELYCTKPGQQHIIYYSESFCYG